MEIIHEKLSVTDGFVYTVKKFTRMLKIDTFIFTLVFCFTKFFMEVTCFDSKINGTLSEGDKLGRKLNMAEICDTGNGGSGVCMTRFNCLKQSGIVRGYCGSYGVCCETTLSCGETNRNKRIIIRNPENIQEMPIQCQYTIEAFSQTVCQLRVDFYKFYLPVPRLVQETYICKDSLMIDDYTLCGENSDQHLYIPFNAANGIDRTTLIFNMPDRDPQSKWHIIITQIECPVKKSRQNNFISNFVSGSNLQDLKYVFSSHNADYDLIAPEGCNQFYTHPTGTIKSFNFNPDGSTYYLPNLNIVICIKNQPGTRMARYTFSHFSLSQQAGDVNYGYDESCHSTAYTPFRKEDYVMIPQSFIDMNSRPTYYCGKSLNENSVVMGKKWDYFLNNGHIVLSK